MENLEMLKCIKIVTDSDLGLQETSLVKPIERMASRGIVVREDGKIALFHKAKMNEYKLPGGGIDKGENPMQAFEREILEEVGCEVKNVKLIGYAEERKSKTNFKQISYVYVCNVERDLGTLSLTEKEKGEGAEMLWVTLKEAQRLIAGSINELKGSPVDKTEGLYATKFIIYRDKAILDYYEKLLNEDLEEM